MGGIFWNTSSYKKLSCFSVLQGTWKSNDTGRRHDHSNTRTTRGFFVRRNLLYSEFDMFKPSRVKSEHKRLVCQTTKSWTPGKRENDIIVRSVGVKSESYHKQLPWIITRHHGCHWKGPIPSKLKTALTLSFPKVINFKFPLQPHHKWVWKT